MSARTIIRPAKPADAQAIARVHLASWRTTYRGIVPDAYLASLSVDQRTAMWANALARSGGGRSVHVAEDEAGTIVGFATGGPERTDHPSFRGELHAIYVLAEHQRQGLGRRLLLPVVVALIDAGITSLLAWVLADNPSRRFYESLGGTPIAEQRIDIGGASLTEVAFAWPTLIPLATRLRSPDF